MSSLPNHGGSDISNLLMSSSSRAVGALSEVPDFQSPAPYGTHAIGSQGQNPRQFEASRYLLPQDRALSKEIAFELLTQGSIAPIAPCRASASPIDKRVAFFFVTGKPTVARNAADSALEVSVSFQSIANSEPWWSPNVHNGQRLGLVARHMSRRTRVQGKAVGGSSGGDSHGSSGGGVSPAGAAAGSSSAGGGGTDELHGYQGRWFCLVQAPCHLIGDKPVKLKCAKAVPGAFSLVQVWAAPDAEMSNALRGKRKRPPLKMHPNSGLLALCGNGSSGYGERPSNSQFVTSTGFSSYHGDGSSRGSASNGTDSNGTGSSSSSNGNGGARGGVGSLGLPGAQRPLGSGIGSANDPGGKGSESEQTGFNSFGSFDPRSLLLLRAGVDGGRVISGPDSTQSSAATTIAATIATASGNNGNNNNGHGSEAYNGNGIVRGWSRSHTTDGNPSRIASSVAKRGTNSDVEEDDDGSHSGSTGSDEQSPDHGGSSEPYGQINSSNNGWNSSSSTSHLSSYPSGDAAGDSCVFMRALDGSTAVTIEAERGFPFLSGPTSTFTSTSPLESTYTSLLQNQTQQSEDWLLKQQQQQQAQLHQHFMQQQQQQRQLQQQQQQRQQQFQQPHAMQQNGSKEDSSLLQPLQQYANLGAGSQQLNHFLQSNPNASLSAPPNNQQHGGMGINSGQNGQSSSSGLPLPSPGPDVSGGALAVQQQQILAFGQLVQQLQDALNQERQERQRLEMVTRHLQQQVDALTQKPPSAAGMLDQHQQHQQQHHQQPPAMPPGLQMLQPKPEPRAPPPPLLPPPPYHPGLLHHGNNAAAAAIAAASTQLSCAPPPSVASGPAATTPTFATAASALPSFGELDAAEEKLAQQGPKKEELTATLPQQRQQEERPLGMPILSSSSSSSSIPCPTSWPPLAPMSSNSGDVQDSGDRNEANADAGAMSSDISDL